MSPAELEAVVWRTFPRATPDQVDTVLAAADAYRAAGVAAWDGYRTPRFPVPDPHASEHRATLADALEWDGQPPYEVRREAVSEGGAA